MVAYCQTLGHGGFTHVLAGLIDVFVSDRSSRQDNPVGDGHVRAEGGFAPENAVAADFGASCNTIVPDKHGAVAHLDVMGKLRSVANHDGVPDDRVTEGASSDLNQPREITVVADENPSEVWEMGDVIRLRGFEGMVVHKAVAAESDGHVRGEQDVVANDRPLEEAAWANAHVVADDASSSDDGVVVDHAIRA